MACLLAVLPTSVPTVSAAEPATKLTTDGNRLESEYAPMLKATRAEIDRALPRIDPSKQAAFSKESRMPSTNNEQ